MSYLTRRITKYLELFSSRKSKREELHKLFQDHGSVEINYYWQVRLQKDPRERAYIELIVGDFVLRTDYPEVLDANMSRLIMEEEVLILKKKFEVPVTAYYCKGEKEEEKYRL